MQTDDLIRSMVVDNGMRERSVRSLLPLALLAGFVIALPVFLLVLGVRGDLDTALTGWRFPFKIAATLILAATAGIAAVRLADPQASTGDIAPYLLAAPLLMLTASGIELALRPAAEWVPVAVGTNSLTCLTSIPLLAMGPLALLLIALRSGAPSSALQAGAIAGVVAGGIAGTLYGIHCPDDSPLFVALWYTMAIAIVATVGAVAGRRWLRW